MRDFLRRIRLPLVFTALLLLTTTLMVVDRRTVVEGGSDHSWLSGVLIEIAAPIQKLIRLPVDLLGETWTDYIALVDLRRQNETLRARLAALEEENLQFREALVASGNLERIVQMRENFEVPLLPSEVVGQDVFPWFRSILLDRAGDGDLSPRLAGDDAARPAERGRCDRPAQPRPGDRPGKGNRRSRVRVHGSGG
jgi:rod shape-determining protein MreC